MLASMCIVHDLPDRHVRAQCTRSLFTMYRRSIYYEISIHFWLPHGSQGTAPGLAGGSFEEGTTMEFEYSDKTPEERFGVPLGTYVARFTGDEERKPMNGPSKYGNA